jgi:hypothetical protein
MQSMSVEVFGIRETLAEIRQVDQQMFFRIRAQMKRAGDTLGDRIRGNIPLMAPTRGFRHSGEQPGSRQPLRQLSVVATLAKGRMGPHRS